MPGNTHLCLASGRQRGKVPGQYTDQRFGSGDLSKLGYWVGRQGPRVAHHPARILNWGTHKFTGVGAVDSSGKSECIAGKG